MPQNAFFLLRTLAVAALFAFPLAANAVAVNDFAQLQTAIDNGGDITIADNIEITSLITINNTVAISGGGTLTRGVTGSLITVESGGSLTLENITIDGNKDVYNTGMGGEGPLVFVNGGSLTMNNGVVLQNNINLHFNYMGGGVYVNNSGMFTMNGGTIDGNTSWYGGGVYVIGNSMFIMNGGKIDGNTNSGNSGCVYVSNNSMFIMTDGEITGNNISSTSIGSKLGGGVYVNNSIFTMNGGKISGNSAAYTGSSPSYTNRGYGGGVYVSSGTLTVGGTAEISGNTAQGETNNVQLRDGAYITLGSSIAAMKIGISTETASGVIVESGATSNDAQYFTADAGGDYKVGFGAGGQLVISNNTLSVTYHGNDNTGGTAPIDNAPYISGARAEVLGAGSLSKTGYYFTFWNTQEDGLGDDYSEGDEIQIDDNTELYAQWEPKTKIAKPTLAQNEFTYNDEEKNAELDATNAAYTLSENTATNVGSYKAIVTLTDTVHTEWKDGTTTDLELDWSIAKADPSYTIPTDLEATYGDQLSSVTLPSGWTWESTGTVGNAGPQTHKATFTPTDIANYNTATGINITITVAKANPSYTIPTDLEATYGDQLSSVTLPSGWAWEETGTVGNAGPQTHKATFTPTDIANYNTATGINITIAVAKANPIVPEVPANLTAEEGQKLAEIVLPENWHWMDDTEYVGTHGTQTHKATFVPEDTENYNTIENIDVKITVSSEVTPILHHVPYPMSHVPKYYTLKGISLGTTKPTAPGIYIEAIGVKAKRIVVR